MEITIPANCTLGDVVCESTHFEILNDNVVEGNQLFNIVFISSDPNIVTFNLSDTLPVNILDDDDREFNFPSSTTVYNTTG